jgi:hypothetical protein
MLLYINANEEKIMSRISIEVTDDQHTKIKIMASLQNKTIREFIIENIFSESKREFNQATIKAIEEVKQNKSLNTYTSVESLFAKLKS